MCGSLGVGFENMRRSWVMKWGAQQGLGVVASRWLGGGEAKAQGRGMRWGGIDCHHCHVFPQNLHMYFGFLSRSGRLLANVRSVYSYTQIPIHFTLILFQLFSCQTHISFLIFYMLDVINWPTHMDLIVVTVRGMSGQLRTHIHTKIHI